MENTSSATYFASWDADLNQVEPQELWGQLGAFTTMKLEIKGRHRCAFFKERHIERLFESLGILNINVPFPKQWIENTMLAAIKGIENKSVYRLRLMVTADRFSIVINPITEPEMHIQGKVWNYTRSNPEAKSLDYQDIFNKFEEIDRSKEELILVSDDGRLLEGASSNLLFVAGGDIIVPKSDRLNGVTLRVLRELLADKFNITEADVRRDDVQQFNEILCSGSGRGVSAILGIEELGWSAKSLDAFRVVRLKYDNACIDYKYENDG